MAKSTTFLSLPCLLVKPEMKESIVGVVHGSYVPENSLSHLKELLEILLPLLSHELYTGQECDWN